MTSERWVPVRGFEFYEVSDRGSVRRLAGSPKCVTTRILKPKPAGKGYLQVCLSGGNRPNYRYIHRLVAEAFIGPLPPRREGEVNHKDGVKTNNDWRNLEYVTSTGNNDHAYAEGLTPSGENHTWAKLTADHVRALRALYSCGWTYRMLGEGFRITQAGARLIALRKTWKYV